MKGVSKTIVPVYIVSSLKSWPPRTLEGLAHGMKVATYRGELLSAKEYFSVRPHQFDYTFT